MITNFSNFWRAFLLLPLCLMVLQCGTHKNAKTPATSHATKGPVFSGESSWYGPGFQGRRTASGERFNMHALTAAHRTLPFGTVLKVTNLDNKKVVIVRINDRGPFAHRRVLDVSYAAAKQLGLIANGKAQIQARVIRQP